MHYCVLFFNRGAYDCGGVRERHIVIESFCFRADDLGADILPCFFINIVDSYHISCTSRRTV